MSEFSWPVRVYYEDTDAGGVVYYANYLKFMERARTEWLRSMGFNQDRLRQESGIIFAVRRAAATYRRPAKLDDELTVTAKVTRRGGASIDFVQQVKRGDEILCDGEVSIAALEAESLRPARIPQAMIDYFEKDDHA